MSKADTAGPVRSEPDGLKKGTSYGEPLGGIPKEMTNTSHRGTNQTPNGFREKVTGRSGVKGRFR